MEDNVAHQVRCSQRHAPGTERGAEAAPLAATGDQIAVFTGAALQAQEALGQDAALEEGVELILDELRQVGPGSIFGLDEAGLSVLLHQPIQRGLFRTVALAVDRGAIRRAGATD